MRKLFFLSMTLLVGACSACGDKGTPDPIIIPPTETVLYTMPEESDPHEGTWLQWPHHYQYGVLFRERLDATWVTMTKNLAQSEKVFLIAYDDTEKTRITALLAAANVPLTNVEFKIYPTDDFLGKRQRPYLYQRQNGANRCRRLGI